MTHTCAGGSPASLEGVTFPGGRFVATTDDAGTTTMTPMLYASTRWLTLDPLANKYYGISPYAFCANNPINCVDPDGKFVGTAMDIISVGLGVRSMVKNIQAGNLRAAFLKKLLNSALIRTRL